MGGEPRIPRFHGLAFRTLPLLVMAAAAAGAAVRGPVWTEKLALLPWLVSLVAVGLPHGAADWAVSRRAWGAATLRIGAAYLACMTAVLGLFIAFPTPMVAAFAALSVWHFGMAHADGQQPPIVGGAITQGIAAVARGGLVLGVPMACWPAATADVADAVVRLVSGRAAGIDPGDVRAIGAATVAVTLLAFAVEAVRSWSQPATRRRTLETAVDLAVIAALGAWATPLFAVGAYFLCWHAWRQMLLLAPAVAGAAPAGPAALGRALAGIHLAGLPLLVPTWLALGATWWLLSPHHSACDLVLLSLAAYLVVTPSHDLLIDMLRHRAVAIEPPRRMIRAVR